MAEQAQVLLGILDLLILKAVSLGSLHGYSILLRIAQISGQALLIEQGALYPALFCLVRQRLLKGTGAPQKTIDVPSSMSLRLRAASVSARKQKLEPSC